MKTQKTVIVFGCDECHKTIESQTGFPYDKGWLYLYNFSFKVGDKTQDTVKDKHFCSFECQLEYIRKLIKKCQEKTYG